jgi:hypothetical protein
MQSVLKSMKEYLTHNVPRYAIILLNGTVLDSKYSNQSLAKIMAALSGVFKILVVGEPFVQMPWVFYRITDVVVVIVPSKIGRKRYNAIFSQIRTEFVAPLTTNYPQLPMSVAKLAKFHLFAVSRESGPEPLSWITVNGVDPLEEQQEWAYAMTALMLLATQTSAKKRDILTFHPYLEEEFLGIIYLFKIPHQKARSGALDACILTTVDYDQRARMFEVNHILEKIMSEIAHELIEAFNFLFKEEINAENTYSEQLGHILQQLHERLEKVILPPMNAEQIRDAMVQTIRDLEARL